MRRVVRQAPKLGQRVRRYSAFATYDHIVDLAKAQDPALQGCLAEFQAEVAQSHNPLATHLYAELIPLAGPRQIRQHLQQLMCLYIRQNDIESAMALLRDVQLQNAGRVNLDYDVLESMLLSAKYQQDAELAWEIVRSIQTMHNNVYARTWGLFLSVVLQAEHFEALQWIHKEACIPGYVVLDDHSYMRMAEIAANHGSLPMAQWAALRMRRRQRSLGLESRQSHDMSMRMFTCLVEAAAVSSLKQDPDATSIRAACRYLVRLREGVSQMGARNLPKFVAALEDAKNYDYVEGIFLEMCADHDAHKAVTTLFLNLILAHLVRQNLPKKALHVFRAGRSGAASVALNEESYLWLIKVAEMHRDAPLLREIAADLPTRKVIEAARNSEQRILESL